MEAGRQHFGKPASIFLLSGKVLNTMLHPLHPLLKSFGVAIDLLYNVLLSIFSIISSKVCIVVIRW